MPNKSRPWIFYGQTQSLCEECLQVVPAKILFQEGNVYYQKRCLAHGIQKTLISTDIEYFKRCKDYLKPGDLPQKFQTSIDQGCPHDCGLCPDHEQHSCLAIFEIIDECNMQCPVCFASSGPGLGNAKTMDEIEVMLQTLLESELEPDLVQISGGEPTLHPQILPILQRLKKSPIRHLMLNTNGIRIANEPKFSQALAQLGSGFEVYLQFDSLKTEALKNIRGIDAKNTRLRALDQLEKNNISTTLVCVIRKGVNDGEIGELIKFAQQWRCVRGLTFQPVQDTGRNHGNHNTQRITLSEIRQHIIQSDNPFGDSDMIPLPCHPEHICIGYGVKTKQKIVPVTGMIPKEQLLNAVDNSITFEKNTALRKTFFDLFSLDACGEQTMDKLESMLCCLPKVEAPELSYENVFRIVIMSFMDSYNFCLGSVKRSCVHFVQPDGKIYPFETWNLFYREQTFTPEE